MGKAISSLKVMQRMERFATHVYLTQIRAFRGREIADRLRAAAVNEQEHADTLTERIEALGGAPSRAGIFYQTAGTLLGFATTLLGRVSLLRRASGGNCICRLGGRRTAAVAQGDAHAGRSSGVGRRRPQPVSGLPSHGNVPSCPDRACLQRAWLLCGRRRRG